MRPLYCLLIVVVSLCSSCAYQVLNADKFLKENEMAKAKKRIDKAVQKDPENPAAQFMLAKYYSHPVWSYDAVDSAHCYIQLVSDTVPNLEDDVAEKLAKKGMDSLSVAKQISIIDSLAFEKANSKNTEESYNYYLNNYQLLKFQEQAIELRNKVAYDNAIAKNTTRAVSEFFRKYPEAPQAQKARNVFETLYYEKNTTNSTLEEYIDYVEERPQTEFAEIAASEILDLISAGAGISDYQRFISRYEQFEASQKAKLILTGLDYRKNTAKLVTHKKDSLFYFYNIGQQNLLSFQLDGVIPDSCAFILQPYILTNKNNDTYAYLKTGVKLTEKDVKSIGYFGAGFFKVNDFGRDYDLIHHSLNDEFILNGLDFKLLDSFHFAKKGGDGWQMISILDEPILKQKVDSIWIERDVFFFKRGKELAIAVKSDFKKLGKEDLKSFSFLYDDYEWLGEQYIKLYSKEYETVVDQNAEVIFPLEKARFNYFDDFWIKEIEGGVTVLDENRNSLFEEELDDYQYRDGVLALQKDSLWSVFSDGLKGFPKFQYDSVRIFSKWLTYAVKDSTGFLIFQSGKKIRLETGENFRVLKNYNVAFSDVSDQIRFVEVSNEQNYFKLFNGFGKKIKEGEQLDISILSPALIQLHQNKKKHLIDSAGTEIEIKNAEAFGAYQNGLIPILQDRKFGALLVKQLTVIPAHSQSKLEVFLKDSLFIFKEDDLFGLSDLFAKVLLPADFERIEFFNDSTAIVEEEGEIGILNINQNEYIHEGIKTWEKVIFDNKNYFIVRKEGGYGVINHLGKEIIPFIFNELSPYNSNGDLFWLAERRLSEINYIVIAYFDQNGKVLFKEGLNFDDYLETACD